MITYIVTLPPGGRVEERSLLGFPRPFRAGIPQSLDLSDGQVTCLRAKGFDVQPADVADDEAPTKAKHVKKPATSVAVED